MNERDLKDYADVLCLLLPSQFERLVFIDLDVDDSRLPGPSAPLRSRAEALVRLLAVERGGDLSALKAAVAAYVKRPEVAALKERVDVPVVSEMREEPEFSFSTDTVAYVNMLCLLRSPQFERLVFIDLDVDDSRLPGPSAPLRSRAEALVRLLAVERGGDLSALKAAVAAYVKRPEVAALKDHVDA